MKQHFPVAIAGDVNAWAVDWCSRETSRRRRALLDVMSTLDVVLLNSGAEPTFSSGEASSIVDLIFVSSSLYTACDYRALLWQVSTRCKPTRIL